MSLLEPIQPYLLTIPEEDNMTNIIILFIAYKVNSFNNTFPIVNWLDCFRFVFPDLTSSPSINEGDSMTSFEATGSTPSRFACAIPGGIPTGSCCRSLMQFALIQANPTCPAVCCFRLTAIYVCSPPTYTFAWFLQIGVLSLWRTISRTLFNVIYFKISVYT